MKAKQINTYMCVGEISFIHKMLITFHKYFGLSYKNYLKHSAIDFIDLGIKEKYFSTKKIILAFLFSSICLDTLSSPLRDCEVFAKDYEYTMSIIGYANESAIGTIGEMIGISLKMNNECRGYATFSMYNDVPIIYLTAYSNVSQGEDLSVVLYGTNDTLTSSVMLPFVSDQILGSVSEPVNLFRESGALSVYEDVSDIKFDDLVRLSSQRTVAYIEGLFAYAIDYQILSASGQVLDSGTIEQGTKKRISIQFDQLYIVRLSGLLPLNNRQFDLLRKIVFKP